MKNHQHGLTLIEVMIAFLVLSAGMLAVVRLQPELRQHAEAARQRSEATRVAQQDIEALRAAAGASLGALVDADYDIGPDGLGSPRYTVQRRVDPAAWPRARVLRVTVTWPDRSGQAQQFRLMTLVEASDPSAEGAMLLAR